jgi:hypothetical protein
VSLRAETYEQVWAMAKFERDNGAAMHVAPGARRTRLLAQASSMAICVQSDRSCAEPIVAVIEPDGETTIVEGQLR